MEEVLNNILNDLITYREECEDLCDNFEEIYNKLELKSSNALNMMTGCKGQIRGIDSCIRRVRKEIENLKEEII